MADLRLAVLLLCFFYYTEGHAICDDIECRLDYLELMYKYMKSKIDDDCGKDAGDPLMDPEAVHAVKIKNGKYPKDCSDLFRIGYRTTGVYLIQPRQCKKPFKVFCHLDFDGWTLVMRRFNGFVDFYRDWNDYKHGFGSVFGEHWLGNDNIHYLTSQKVYELHIEFTYWATDLSYYAHYGRFRLGSEADLYKLHVTGYSGNSGSDGFSNFNGVPFSTKDKDHDTWPNQCAQTFKGAFWYKKCHSYFHPNGLYKSSCAKHDCMQWGKYKPVKSMIMKVKPL